MTSCSGTLERPRWDRTWERMARPTLDRQTFTREVLRDAIPPDYASRIFRVFVDQPNEMTYKDFICTMVILLKVFSIEKKYILTTCTIPGNRRRKSPICFFDL